MDSSIITATAAIMGSLAGAMSSIASTWFTQRYQDRRDQFSRRFSRRETLYSEFIIEAASRYSDALVHELKDPQAMASLWSLLARIRLNGSESVIEAAEAIGFKIGDQFTKASLTPEEIRQLFIEGDPLKGFSEACRAELDSLDRGHR